MDVVVSEHCKRRYSSRSRDRKYQGLQTRWDKKRYVGEKFRDVVTSRKVRIVTDPSDATKLIILGPCGNVFVVRPPHKWAKEHRDKFVLITYWKRETIIDRVCKYFSTLTTTAKRIVRLHRKQG